MKENIDWSIRRRTKRIVPLGCKTDYLKPDSIAVYVGNISMTDPRFGVSAKEIFIPSCINPFPERIDYLEWMAVDSMTCKREVKVVDKKTSEEKTVLRDRRFVEDWEWFEGIIESLYPYIDIIDQASKYLYNIIADKPEVNLETECNNLYIPLFLERLVTRRMILLIFKYKGDFTIIARWLRYKPGRDRQYRGLRTLLSRVGLDLDSACSPFTSIKVFSHERVWIRDA